MIVQKFGGVAMKNEVMRGHSINHVKTALQKYDKVIIVVSAIGRLGDPYATDSLINLSRALANDSIAKDLIASCGEIIAASVLSSELHQFGIQNRILHGLQTGIVTRGDFGDALIDTIDPSFISEALKQSNCIIVPGFQGMNQNGQMMTLGRGGSDLTAVALADALKATHVEFFKDVPGVLTGDPTVVSTYEKFDQLNFKQLLSLVKTNHAIIQERAVSLAQEKTIPLYVRGIATNETGTWITN